MINVSSHAEIREGIAELQAAQVEFFLQTFFSRCARLISWQAAQIGSFPSHRFRSIRNRFLWRDSQPRC